MADVAKACTRETCNPQETGRCELENDPIESCSNYSEEEVDLDFGEDQSEEARPSETKLTELRSSELISPEALWPLTMTFPYTTVAVVGAFRSGKTTLVASLFDAFCKGPFAGFRFRSSRTLTAFESRRYYALAKSGLEVPSMPRTSRAAGLGYFHLNVADESGRSRHLMIAERSGETYEDAQAETSLIADLHELKLADCVCFILDCARLTDRDTRAAYGRSFKQQIRAFRDNDAFGPAARLQIVATKLDTLAPKGEAKPVLNELDEYEAMVTEEFASEGVKLETLRVCANPRSNFLVGLVGLDTLFQSWFADRPLIDLRPRCAPGSVRQIDRLLQSWTTDDCV